jgi:hypothetical protein
MSFCLFFHTPELQELGGARPSLDQATNSWIKQSFYTKSRSVRSHSTKYQISSSIKDIERDLRILLGNFF